MLLLLDYFSGPGKSPEQWHHQEAHEMGGHMGGGGGGGEDDEQLNNYDTGAGFFQVWDVVFTKFIKQEK